LTAGQKTPVRDELQKQGYTNFLVLAEAAGLKEPASNAVLTIFAPTNQAIDEFLKNMQLTLADAKSRPGLAAAVAAYHVLPRVKGRVSDVKDATPAKPLEAVTADNYHFLKFFMGPKDAVVIQDVQNNTAQITGRGVEVGNVMIYGIDKVLLSGDVFLTLPDLLARHPAFQPLKDLFDKAGLEDEVKNMGGVANSITVWAPTADAVKSAQPLLAALSKPQLQDVLRYHIVPAALSIPAGLEDGKSYPTAFKGHNLKFKYTGVPSATKATGQPKGKQEAEQASKKLEIIPEDGTFNNKPSANTTGPVVTLANLFANRMVIHGIDQVLKPNLPGSRAASGTSKPRDRPAAANGGRKLLQFRQGTGPSTFSAGLTATQSSIRAAVDGRASAAEAAEVGGASARAGTRRCWNCVVDDSIIGH